MAFRRKTIVSQKTVGRRLRDERRRRKLTIEEVEEGTKIRTKYLSAIEKDRWNEFPSRVYALGFVKSYSQFLGLNSSEVVEKYKAEFLEPQKRFSPKRIKEGFLTRLIVTPRLLLALAIALIICVAIGYVGYSLNRFSKPPRIEILSPTTDSADKKALVIEGKTDSTADVEINSQPVDVGDDGHFSQSVELVPGVNFFEVKAKSRLGREATRVVKILYEQK